MNNSSHSQNNSRRKFLKSTGSALFGSGLAFNILTSPKAFAANSDTLKVGLIGCGGRGTGAAKQALNADENVVLTALGDVFEDRLTSCHEVLTKILPEKVKVSKENQFIGFDAYQKVIDSGVDVVLLATPPGFRPDHLTAAIDAGKHVFCEKPVAVDAPGVRKVLEAAKKAKENNQSLVSGFCWRYHYPKRASFEKVLGGAVGDIHAVYNTYNTSTLWSKPRQPGWTEMEYQLRNWLYYNWLSGDHIAEQAVHSLDMMSWAMGDVPPKSAVATGGRQVRTDPEFGNIYDHFAVVYEYDNGAKGYHFSRQQLNCANSYAVDIAGTKGKVLVDCTRGLHQIDGVEKWRYQGEQNDMYQTEHDELFASIRNGKPMNDGEWMAQSTLLAIMGRMAAYTGQEITWDMALNSQETLGPDHYSWDLEVPVAAVPLPGITKYI
jgi:myo-inositol 2-dehydrogenase / D-chiro-inositol 1-dehydrogenase